MAIIMGHEVDLNPAFDKMIARLAKMREANKKALVDIQSQIDAFDATPDELLEEDASLFMMPDQDADDMTVVSGDGIKRGKNVPEDTPSVFQQPYSEQPQNAYNSRQNEYTTQGFQCQVPLLILVVTITTNNHIMVIIIWSIQLQDTILDMVVTNNKVTITINLSKRFMVEMKL